MSDLDLAPTASHVIETPSLDEAIRLIWQEADLLDTHDYKPWLALWSETGHYIIPIERSVTDYGAHLNVAYDDAEMRQARVKRLVSGFAMSSAPAARTVRTVSRFRMLETGANLIVVRAAQHIVEYKYERTRVLAADVTYRLIRKNKDLKLEQKVVQFINSDDALFSLGYLP